MYRMLFPDSSRSFEGVHVYYLHRFSVNGVWLGGSEVLVQETARLREVEGGIDEPVPRVTAHELGHVLGLQHRQDRTNLLASGTTGTTLNTREVETARAAAVRKYKAMRLEELQSGASEAEKSGDQARATRLRAWLDQIASPDIAKPKTEALGGDLPSKGPGD
jgi:Matrixin